MAINAVIECDNLAYRTTQLVRVGDIVKVSTSHPRFVNIRKVTALRSDNTEPTQCVVEVLAKIGGANYRKAQADQLRERRRSAEAERQHSRKR